MLCSLITERLASSSKQHSSTVALVPPETAWAPIQKVREELHDKGLYRWPPHINLLYPFLPFEDFAAATLLLAPALSSLQASEITLDSLGCFGGRKNGVLYAHCSSEQQTAALIKIQATLQDALPFLTHQQRNGIFTPHMTLSHFGSREAAEAAKEALASNWAPVNFRLDDTIHVLRREGGGGQFERHATLGFCGASLRVYDPPRRFDSMLREEAAWMQQAR